MNINECINSNLYPTARKTFSGLFCVPLIFMCIKDVYFNMFACR